MKVHRGEIHLGDHVTVVIPACNLAPYLDDAMRSVQLQDYSGPVSIVILDDGSSDGTLDVANRLAAAATNVRVYTQANQGRARTRNRLLNLAETELVAWLDGDDLAAPNWITDQVTYLSRHPDCVAVAGQGYAMMATGDAIGPIDHPLAGDEIDRRHLAGEANAFLQSCVLTRKSAVLQAGGYNEKYPAAEDYDLWLRLAEVGRLANVSACHLYYRVHPKSANWTINVEQRTQGHAIMNEARRRRGLAPIEQPVEEIPPPSKDDWNRRLYWINMALKSGNPKSALHMLRVALPRHPDSLLMWLAAAVAVCDCVLFLGNSTPPFRPGEPPRIGSLPWISSYRLGRWLVRLRRRLLGRL